MTEPWTWGLSSSLDSDELTGVNFVVDSSRFKITKFIVIQFAKGTLSTEIVNSS